MSNSIVSMRNHFDPADELVDKGMAHMPLQFHTPEMRSWMLAYTKDVIRKSAHAFGLAASRGIEQCAELLCNPLYGQKRKQARERQTKRFKQEMADQEFEQKRRLTHPTEDELKSSIKWHEQECKWLEGRVLEHQAALNRLREMYPAALAESLALLQ